MNNTFAWFTAVARDSAALLSVLWLLGLTATALPVVVSLIHNRILGNAARSVVDAEPTRLLSDLCRNLGVRRTVRLLETDKSILPMTWGLLRPVVLLPITWRDWSPERQRFVLLHELAHVMRCDVAPQLLARLVCAVYWYHPLAWYALWRMRIERELACDDCVLMAGGRPSDYAQQLVELVRSHRILAMPAAVAIAHSTRLERRVRAVLDQARSHVPLGRTIAHVLLICTAIVVTGVAAVRPGTREQPQEEKTKIVEAAFADDRADEPASQASSTEHKTTVSGHVLDSNDQPVSGATKTIAVADVKLQPSDQTQVFSSPAAANSASKPKTTSESAASRKMTVRGSVVSPDGRPVGGATVTAARFRSAGIGPYGWERDRQELARDTTEQDGRFSLTFPDLPRDEPQDRQSPDRWRRLRIVGLAEGFGPAWVETRDLNRGEELTLQLARDDVPITGQILDLKGQPAANVTVRVHWLWKATSGEAIDRWRRVVSQPYESTSSLATASTSEGLEVGKGACC